MFPAQTLQQSSLSKILKLDLMSIVVLFCDFFSPACTLVTVTPFKSCIFLPVFCCFFLKELIWKVARYTSAAPMYFTECDNYMDGGVLANNPSLSAWTAIQAHHDAKHLPRPKVAVAVSLGTGVYPSQELGETDFLGKGLFNLRGTMRRAQRFIRMISTAVSCEGDDCHCSTLSHSSLSF